MLLGVAAMAPACVVTGTKREGHCAGGIPKLLRSTRIIRDWRALGVAEDLNAWSRLVNWAGHNNPCPVRVKAGGELSTAAGMQEQQVLALLSIPLPHRSTSQCSDDPVHDPVFPIPHLARRQRNRSRLRGLRLPARPLHPRKSGGVERGHRRRLASTSPV